MSLARLSLLFTSVSIGVILGLQFQMLASFDSTNVAVLPMESYKQEQQQMNNRLLKARKAYPDGAQMGTEQMDSITSVLPPTGNLLVWGLGNDSPYWHSVTDGTVIFLEDDNEAEKDGVMWYDSIVSKYPYLNSHKVHYTTKNNKDNLAKYMKNPWSADLKIANLPQAVRDIAWDVIIVDAPLGCCDMGPARFQSLFHSLLLARNSLLKRSVKEVHVFVDDYEREIERKYSQRVFGKAPVKVTTRKSGVSNANQQAHFVFHRNECIIDTIYCTSEAVPTTSFATIAATNTTITSTT
jgi:uncharacterized protein (TIGR01627 family)